MILTLPQGSEVRGQITATHSTTGVRGQRSDKMRLTLAQRSVKVKYAAEPAALGTDRVLPSTVSFWLEGTGGGGRRRSEGEGKASEKEKRGSGGEW